jgi:hypothetical protein
VGILIPLFIGGTGRSGTTIALQLLGSHSKVYAYPLSEIKVLTEKGGVLDKYLNKAISLKDVQKEHFKAFNDYGVLDIDDVYWGDSSPDNIRSSPILSEVFPNSKFIHMIRDGRDSGYSEYEIMGGQLHAKTPFDGLEFWHKRLIQSVKALNKLDESKGMSVRLENLVYLDREFEKERLLAGLNLKNEIQFTSFFNNQVGLSRMSLGKWKKMTAWKEYDMRYNLVIEDLKSKDILIEKYY